MFLVSSVILLIGSIDPDHCFRHFLIELALRQELFRVLAGDEALAVTGTLEDAAQAGGRQVADEPIFDSLVEAAAWLDCGFQII